MNKKLHKKNNVQQRYNCIINELKQYGERDIPSFAKILNVNEITIRRDLKTLENQNLLIRTPKGARNMPTCFMGYYHDQEIQESLRLKQNIVQFIVHNIFQKNDHIFIGLGPQI